MDRERGAPRFRRKRNPFMLVSGKGNGGGRRGRKGLGTRGLRKKRRFADKEAGKERTEATFQGK